MRFVDLFAGLGGFHVGLSRLGHQCVFASELNEDLQTLYERNFGLRPHGDIRGISAAEIPEHDILCAGSPCQPFSKAGEQQGLDCPKWGDLFDHVLRILRFHKPRYVILENVPNLQKHDGGATWADLKAALEKVGYEIDTRCLSPHQYGVPQIRQRVFIVGSRTGLGGFEWPTASHEGPLSIESVLDQTPQADSRISEQAVRCLRAWQRFIRAFPKASGIPSFPIWSAEFGATYPFEETTPYAVGGAGLEEYRGSHGQRLASLSARERLASLPSYARAKTRTFPAWKIAIIRQNRELYRRHRTWLKPWVPEISEFPASLQKLEWHCKGGARNIWDYLIQFRASGVRVKRPTSSPSLVAMTVSQVPIIGWHRRYMTPRECARLQSLHELAFLPDTTTRAYKALGNAVNADVVERIASGFDAMADKGGSHKAAGTRRLQRALV